MGGMSVFIWFKTEPLVLMHYLEKY